MSEIDLLPKAQRTSAGLDRDAEITVRLHAPLPGMLGPVLDQLMPLLREVTDVLAAGGITAEVDLPGFTEVFYGYEQDGDNG